MNSKSILIIVLATALTAGATAQPHHRDEPRNKEQMLQRVEDVRKMKLMDILGLQGAQVEQFFAAYNPAQKEVVQRRKSIDSIAEVIRKSERDQADDAAMKKASEDLLAAMRGLEQAINKRHADIKSTLSVRQYALYLAFEAKFQEELMRTILKRARRE